MSPLSLISISSWIASKVANKGFDSIYDKIVADKKINEKFYSAVNKVSASLQKKYPDILGDSIDYFFKKEEVFNELFKLLFRSSVVNHEKIAETLDVTTLPNNFINEFVTELRQELLNDRVFDEILSNNELYIVFQGLSSSIKEIEHNSTITSIEITKLNKLLEEKIGSAFDYDQFIYLYTKNAINNLSQVNFLGLGIDISIKKNRKNLQDIFVKPFFEIAELKNSKKDLKADLFGRQPEIIDYKNLLNVNDRIVILGNPGAGKSILIKSLICDILNKKSNEFKSKKVCEFVPFRIELRNYLAFKKEHKGNLVKYLIFILEHEYQISNVTETILTTILTQKNCLLFFDGLDEIFDLSDKINVRNDIENFHNLFSKIKSIVTSRIIGYEEASLNKSFTELHILNFDDNQINAYVNQWYSKEEEIEEVRIREINGFLNKKHEIDKELITNPLLLSLIIILYRNILKLPESKLEIYQSCTKTLVDKWDASKDLIIDLDETIYKTKDKLFADLAYWQYKELSGKTDKITYEKAKENISSSLIRLGIGDEFTSEELAEKFMIYAQRRSIYFENNFTHKTFLEYYTAYWIYSNIEKKHKVAERNSLISSYIGNPFWFIVFELLFNLIDKDQADNEIIDELFQSQIKNSDSFQFLLSVSFKLKNISLKTIETTVTNSIISLIKSNITSPKNNKSTSVFNSLSLIFTPKEYPFEVLMNRFLELETQLKDSFDELKELYILCQELNLNLLMKGIPKYVNFPFQYKNLYKKCCETDIRLFALDYYCNSTSRNKLHYFVRFLQIFGAESLNKDFNSQYGELNLGHFFNALVYYLTEDTFLKKFSQNILLLDKNGLSKDAILKYTASRSTIYIGETDLKLILKYFPSSSDDYFKKLFSVVILNAQESFSGYGDKDSFKDLLIKYDHLPEVSIILSNKNKTEKLANLLSL